MYVMHVILYIFLAGFSLLNIGKRSSLLIQIGNENSCVTTIMQAMVSLRVKERWMVYAALIEELIVFRL